MASIDKDPVPSDVDSGYALFQSATAEELART